jgi:hypothetical protein
VLYIVDIQRLTINPIGGGKCIESHKVIKKVEYKDKEKVWEKEEGKKVKRSISFCAIK